MGIADRIYTEAEAWMKKTGIVPKVCYLGRDEWAELSNIALRDHGVTLMPWHKPELQGRTLFLVALESYMGFGI